MSRNVGAMGYLPKVQKPERACPEFPDPFLLSRNLVKGKWTWHAQKIRLPLALQDNISTAQNCQ